MVAPHGVKSASTTKLKSALYEADVRALGSLPAGRDKQQRPGDGQLDLPDRDAEDRDAGQRERKRARADQSKGCVAHWNLGRPATAASRSERTGPTRRVIGSAMVHHIDDRANVCI